MGLTLQRCKINDVPLFRQNTIIRASHGGPLYSRIRSITLRDYVGRERKGGKKRKVTSGGCIRARKRHRSLNLAATLFPAVRCAEIVPLYAPGQNARNEKYIQTSIANRHLRLLTKSFNRKYQEGVFVFLGKISTRPNLPLTPTSHYGWSPLKIQDFELKVRVTETLHDLFWKN